MDKIHNFTEASQIKELIRLNDHPPRTHFRFINVVGLLTVGFNRIEEEFRGATHYYVGYHNLYLYKLEHPVETITHW